MAIGKSGENVNVKKLNIKFGELIIIKNGEHRLSRKSDLKKICSELNIIAKKIPSTK